MCKCICNLYLHKQYYANHAILITIEFYQYLLRTTLTCKSISINVNQSHNNRIFLASLCIFATFSIFPSRSYPSGQTGALQPRELLLRRQSHLPRRTGRSRRCPEEDPSLCPQHLPGASGASGSGLQEVACHITSTRTSDDKQYELMIDGDSCKCKRMQTAS